jgi:hypothetical protein
LRLSLRFVLPLLLTLAVLAFAVTPLVDRLTLRWFTNDLDLRARLIANTIDEPLDVLIAMEDSVRIRQFFTRMAEDERLYAMALCAGTEAVTVATPSLPSDITCANAGSPSSGRDLRRVEDRLLLVSARPLTAGGSGNSVILVHCGRDPATATTQLREWVQGLRTHVIDAGARTS